MFTIGGHTGAESRATVVTIGGQSGAICRAIVITKVLIIGGHTGAESWATVVNIGGQSGAIRQAMMITKEQEKRANGHHSETNRSRMLYSKPSVQVGGTVWSRQLVMSVEISNLSASVGARQKTMEKKQGRT